MPRRLASILVFAALALAACGSSDDPVLDAGSAPGEPTTSADHGGSKQAGAAAAPCSPQGTSLTVTAKSTAWDTDCLAVPGGQEFSITMENQDSVAHSVAILESHSSTSVLFRGELHQGPGETTYNVPALSPGTYVFHCEVHPTDMRGTFIVA